MWEMNQVNNMNNSLDKNNSNPFHRRLFRLGVVLIMMLIPLACSLSIKAMKTPTPTSEPTVTPNPTATQIPLPEYLVDYQKSCSTPIECAQKLVKMGWKGQTDISLYGVDNFAASPAVSLNKNSQNKKIKLIGGDCEDFAIAIAFGVEDNDFPPLLLYLVSPNWSLNHALYVFQEGERWSYVDINPTTKEILTPPTNYDSVNSLFSYGNSISQNRWYLYYLSNLNKTQDSLKKKYNMNLDWRTYTDSIPLVPEGDIDQGPK